MAVKFRDYYEVLGVGRGADAEEIRRAYRQLARKHHPDVSKGDRSSEDKFKEINEAYEVLKDPEKRRKYDALGANWKAGDQFNGGSPFNGAGGSGFNFGGFSDFFSAMFGNQGQGPPRGAPAGTGMEAEEVELRVPISTVVNGGVLGIRYNGRSFDVRIPKGIAEGKKIRLAGEGSGGADVLLQIRYADDEHYRVEDDTLVTDARISPATAALGGRVPVATPEGEINLTIPAGSSSGKRLRLRGMGLPRPAGDRGDLLVEVVIAIPVTLSEEQRSLYEQLQKLEKS
jgi:curved DNA-binding protein